jgi:hypothetical protein
MLASFSGKWFIYSEKDIGIGPAFLILRFRAQTHVAKGISNYYYVFLVLFTYIYFPFLNYLHSNSIPFPHPPLYIMRCTPIPFFILFSFSLFPCFFYPLIPSCHFFSVLLYCIYFHLGSCFPLCCIYSASPSSPPTWPSRGTAVHPPQQDGRRHD